MPCQTRTLTICADHERETAVGPRLLDGKRIGGRNCDFHVVRAEEERGRPHHRTRDGVRTRRVVRIGRSVGKGQPCRITGRIRVAVHFSFLDGRDRSPDVVKLLAVPGSDDRVRPGEIRERIQPGAITDPRHMFRGEFPEGPVELRPKVVEPEPGDVRLLGSAGAAGQCTLGLDLVVVGGVASAGQFRRRRCPEPGRAGQHERMKVGHERKRERRRRRQRRWPEVILCRAPFADDHFAEIRWRQRIGVQTP